MTGEVTQKSQVPSGMIIGIRGEYNGAQIQIFNGEKIYIGRSSESNLVLSNKKASRKHCSIAYDAKEDKYSIVNYSSIFLSCLFPFYNTLNSSSFVTRNVVPCGRW